MLAGPGEAERPTIDRYAVSPEEAIRPYRHLAVRVLARALMDIATPGGSAADRESARTFLNGSGMLLHWCRVASLEPTRIVTLAKKLGGTARPLPV